MERSSQNYASVVLILEQRSLGLTGNDLGRTQGPFCTFWCRKGPNVPTGIRTSSEQSEVCHFTYLLWLTLSQANSVNDQLTHFCLRHFRIAEEPILSAVDTLKLQLQNRGRTDKAPNIPSLAIKYTGRCMERNLANR
jgi:hypothetical protein